MIVLLLLSQSAVSHQHALPIFKNFVSRGHSKLRAETANQVCPGLAWNQDEDQRTTIGECCGKSPSQDNCQDLVEKCEEYYTGGVGDDSHTPGYVAWRIFVPQNAEGKPENLTKYEAPAATRAGCAAFCDASEERKDWCPATGGWVLLLVGILIAIVLVILIGLLDFARAKKGRARL
jgi:hypothetical protein